MSRRGAATRLRSDGAGLISTVSGVVVFLVVLLFAVQLLVMLHLSTTVGAAAERAVLDVATTTTHDPGSVERATSRLRQSLGELGASSATSIVWRVHDDDGNGVVDTVEVDVRVRTPLILPSRFGGALGLDVIDEQARARIEQPVT